MKPQIIETIDVDSITQCDATHNRWTVTVAGVTREFGAEITEQHPDERVAGKSVDGEGGAWRGEVEPK